VESSIAIATVLAGVPVFFYFQKSKCHANPAQPDQ
jgi:hypothetical protein